MPDASRTAGIPADADLFQLLSANICDYALFVIDADRRVQTWNPGAERLLGYPAEEIIGKSADVFFTPEDIAAGQPEREVEQALATNRGDDDRWHVRKNGERFWSAGVLTPLRNAEGHVHGFCKLMRDETELRLADDARRASEERFRGLMDQAPFSIQVLAPSGHTVRVNRAWEELWGLTADAIKDYNILADPQLETKGVAPLLRRAFEGHAVSLPEILYDPEETLPHRSQHPEPVRSIAAVAFPVKGAEGEVREVVLVHEDVTARRRAEESVREKAEALSGILAASVDHIFVVGRDGRYRYVSSGGLSALGFDGHDLTGLHWREAGLSASVMEPFDADRDAALQSGRSVRREVTFESPQGVDRHYEYVVFPLPRTEGPPDAVVVISRDVTVRRHAEEALDRYRLLSEHTRDIVLFVRPNGSIVEANDAAATAYGYPRETLATMTIADLRESSTVENIPEQIAAAAESGILFETVHRRTDGSCFPVEVSSRSAEICGERLLLSVVRDISARKAAEAALVRNEQVSRFLADAGAALAALTDRDATLKMVATMAVPRFADWCAIDMFDDGVFHRVAVVHSDPQKVELAHELHSEFPPTPDLPQGLWHIVRTGEPELVTTITNEMLLAVEPARRRELLLSLGLRSYIGVPLKVRDEVFGVVTFVAAESGRQFDESDLALAQDFAQRAATSIENVRLYEDLKRADRRKDEFLAMLAHELRNPLAPIRSGLDLLQMAGAEPEVTDLMATQVEHLVRLVDDLLDVSRILRGRVDLQRKPIAVSEVVRRAVETVRPSIEAQRQELRLSLPADVVYVDADPVRLSQVLVNLLGNASKYTEAGGEIRLAAQVADEQLVIEVSDTGIGIDPQLLPHVFELFTQSTRSIDRSQGGLGIGLTIVKNLTEMHGGTVTAFSEGPGKGSRFTLRLATLQTLPESVLAAQDDPKLVPRRILIVDDNVPAAKLLVRLLAKLGPHEIVTSYDGEAALAAYEAYRPDLILLDIGLPKLDGYEVARRLRARPDSQGTLLVALTGYGTEDDRRRSHEAGFDDHIVKPPALATLKSVLKRLETTGNPRNEPSGA